jgi:hypothetical protein
MSKREDGMVSIFNEDGKLKTKEEFTNEMGEIYDECVDNI